MLRDCGSDKVNAGIFEHVPDRGGSKGNIAPVLTHRGKTLKEHTVLRDFAIYAG